jgi:hypothetical protein
MISMIARQGGDELRGDVFAASGLPSSALLPLIYRKNKNQFQGEH